MEASVGLVSDSKQHERSELCGAAASCGTINPCPLVLGLSVDKPLEAVPIARNDNMTRA